MHIPITMVVFHCVPPQGLGLELGLTHHMHIPITDEHYGSIPPGLSGFTSVPLHIVQHHACVVDHGSWRETTVRVAQVFGGPASRKREGEENYTAVVVVVVVFNWCFGGVALIVLIIMSAESFIKLSLYLLLVDNCYIRRVYTSTRSRIRIQI